MSKKDLFTEEEVVEVGNLVFKNPRDVEPKDLQRCFFILTANQYQDLNEVLMGIYVKNKNKNSDYIGGFCLGYNTHNTMFKVSKSTKNSVIAWCEMPKIPKQYIVENKNALW